jgi:hypothetical protein
MLKNRPILCDGAIEKHVVRRSAYDPKGPRYHFKEVVR